jgi:hypothetical protein
MSSTISGEPAPANNPYSASQRRGLHTISPDTKLSTILRTAPSSTHQQLREVAFRLKEK